ncbi:hypothetical protein AAVH_18114, partial [Aphelenchoides avenae]
EASDELWEYLMEMQGVRHGREKRQDKEFFLSLLTRRSFKGRQRFQETFGATTELPSAYRAPTTSAPAYRPPPFDRKSILDGEARPVGMALPVSLPGYPSMTQKRFLVGEWGWCVDTSTRPVLANPSPPATASNDGTDWRHSHRARIRASSAT